nr:hypothetical protein [Mycoplasmopsis bovis]
MANIGFGKIRYLHINQTANMKQTTVKQDKEKDNTNYYERQNS